MDVETSEAIERINDSLVELRTELHDVRTELHDGLASIRTELRDEIREGVAEAKRFARVLHEDLKHDIRIVAEGVAHLSAMRDSGRQ